MVELSAHNGAVIGSSPVATTNKGLLAQLDRAPAF